MTRLQLLCELSRNFSQQLICTHGMLRAGSIIFCTPKDGQKITINLSVTKVNPLAPTLFGLYVQLKGYITAHKGLGYSLADPLVSVLLYHDDAALMSSPAEDALQPSCITNKLILWPVNYADYYIIISDNGSNP